MRAHLTSRGGSGIAVRPATEADIPWLLEQLPAFDREYPSTLSFVPTATYAVAQLRELVAGGACFVAWAMSGEHAVERLGFIAGQVLPGHLYNPGIRTLACLLWWVLPAHRGTSAAHRLLDAFTAHGREYADWTTLSLPVTTPMHLRSLERAGFRAQEVTYVMESR